MWVDLVFAATYGLAAAVMPGPLAAFLISHSLTHGFRRTAPAAFSPLLSDGPIALVVLLILTRVPPSMVQLLRLFGGLFLLYLALGAWRAYRSLAGGEPPPEPAASGLLKAAAVNLLNPNPYIGWSLVLGPLFLRAWRTSAPGGGAVLLGFYGTMVVSNLVIIAVFSAASSAGPRFQRALLGLSALGLAGFGAYQLWLWATSGGSV